MGFYNLEIFFSSSFAMNKLWIRWEVAPLMKKTFIKKIIKERNLTNIQAKIIEIITVKIKYFNQKNIQKLLVIITNS
jgi:hypothetical protein